MSRELQLHYPSLNHVSTRVQDAETLKDIFSKSGKRDLKHFDAAQLRKIMTSYRQSIESQPQSTKDP